MANSDDHNKRTETVCHLKNRAQSAVEKLRSLCVRMVEYLDGIFYYERDVPAGSPWIVDPLAGKIGVLDRVAGLASSPGHTAQQRQLAILIDNVIARIRTDLQQVRKDAISYFP